MRMRQIKLRKFSCGVGMVEILIGITISSLLTIAVVTVYLSQNVMFNQQSSRNQAASNAWDVYALVTGLVRHSQVDSFDINYGSGGRNPDGPENIELLGPSDEVVNDEITVTFSLPVGMKVWPNDVAPFDKNVVRLTWKSFGDDRYKIQVELNDGSGFGAPILIAGGTDGSNTRIINFDMWPLDSTGALQANLTDSPDGGFRVLISTRASMAVGESDPVFTVSGSVLPKNS